MHADCTAPPCPTNLGSCRISFMSGGGGGSSGGSHDAKWIGRGLPARHSVGRSVGRSGAILGDLLKGITT